MGQTQFDKIKFAFSRMDNDFWERVTKRSTELSEKTANLTANVNENFTKLAIAQLEILNAKYKGYERLISSEESNIADIIRENKACIGGLTEKKDQTATALFNLLAELNAIIEEVRTLGENTNKGDGT